ncbi:armadillo-type protein [Dipodascopsis tothii]|uniref:armadillo-type protein n=1 Tax=Dipodascopsis tothii TaxID=44089 RepID=UPI0034CE08F6
MDDFNLSESLTAYLSDPASLVSRSLQESDADDALDVIIDAIAMDPAEIGAESHFDMLQEILYLYPTLSQRSTVKLADLIISGLSGQADISKQLIENDEHEMFGRQRRLLEMYSFLLHWAVTAVEQAFAEQVPRSRTRNKNTAQDDSKVVKEVANQLQNFLDVMCKVQKLKLSKLFLTTSERDLFVSLFTRPAYIILENEQQAKNLPLRMHAFKVLCIAIKHNGHALAAQTSLMQSLTYYEHLSDHIAELLQILFEQYDYPQLTDEILRDISHREFNANDTKGPKSMSSFLVRISELLPRLVMKHMITLVKHLDSESYVLRCAILEVCGNIICDLSKQEDTMETYKSQINSFFDLFEERFLDVNPYCRSKSIQILSRLCELETKFSDRRQKITTLAVRSLQDRSSHVRRNAIKLLSKLISTHPFSMLHGGQLSYDEWKTRLDQVNNELETLQPMLGHKQSEYHEPGDLSSVDDNLLESPSDDEDNPEADITAQVNVEDIESIESINRLRLTRRYYLEAIAFIESIHRASNSIVMLLSAKNKSEVIESMDFFVIADAYKIEVAKEGIRKMIHLIWTKTNSDEGKGIQTHLIECYNNLFFIAPQSFSENDRCTYITRNIISLTYEATLAELTSLERLLGFMMKNGQIPELVIQKLWQVYGIQQRDISRSQRRGAIIVLGMLAVHDNNIVINELETLYNVGLGSFGNRDFVLARYTCIALQRLTTLGQKFPANHAIISRLIKIVEIYSEKKAWYPLAEEAINAIYSLSHHPDVICSSIIRDKLKIVFAQPTELTAGDRPQSATCALSQLFFAVGHIAIKQIVHMESCEIEFKRRKAMLEKDKTVSSANSANEELDLISGTSEDDFAEAMAHIRERELLHDNNSLLTTFGSMVVEVCSNFKVYDDEQLQLASTLCLAKLMCVSSAFCEQNLPLLLAILENSSSAVIRSNLVIALGDMAVCFNHLVDESTTYLYQRLHDDDPSVQRTCLMTLTFLILAGQVKVKGQLGEMAKCLEDSDKHIADLAKMFFTELSRKDNAIYNAFTDIFSTLANDKSLEEDEFKRIIKFLTSFIEKERHAKQLSEKLATRLGSCETERQWHEITYALSLLPHKNEDIQKVVEEGFNYVSTSA